MTENRSLCPLDEEEKKEKEIQTRMRPMNEPKKSRSESAFDLLQT